MPGLPGPRPPPLGRPRAGRLPRRAPRVPPPGPRRRPARAHPAARDRARSSRSASSSRRAPASPTSAPAAAPSRSRSRTSGPTSTSWPPTSPRTRWTSRAPTRPASASTSPSRRPTCSSGIEAPAAGLDAVLANPPYVAEADRASLQREITDHEPALAVFGGEDGLARHAPPRRPGGRHAARAAGARDRGSGQAAELAGAAGRRGLRRDGARRTSPGSTASSSGGAERRCSRRATPRSSRAASRSGASPSCRPTRSTAWPASPTRSRPCAGSTALKRRRLDKPSAVLFFALDLALAALPELGPRTRRRPARAAARAR